MGGDSFSNYIKDVIVLIVLLHFVRSNILVRGYMYLIWHALYVHQLMWYCRACSISWQSEQLEKFEDTKEVIRGREERHTYLKISIKMMIRKYAYN